MSARASDTAKCIGVQPPTPPAIADVKFAAGSTVGISLFTGAMAWDLGLERGAGVRFLLTADSCAAVRTTIKANRPGMRVLDDVSRLTASKVREAAGLGPDDVIDVVAGCPPCQSWSRAGRRRGIADSGGMLVPRFVDLAVEVRPRIVVMENVIGLASAELGGERGGVLRLIVHELRRNGYRVAHDILNAADFGSPQDRRRLILIASLDADPVIPEPTHSRDGANGLPQWRTLRDALEGLPDRPCTFLPYPPRVLRYYAALKAGQNWHNLPPDLQRESRGDTGRFMGGTSFCRRLAWDKPCPTLTCEPTSKTVGRCHPDEDRPLSVEEYARIQGFPDDWTIRGGTAARYRQIGNAVPVPLSAAVGRAVAKALGHTPLPPAPADRPIEVAPPPPPARLSGDVSKKGDGVLAWLIRLPGDRCPFATHKCSRLCYARRNFFRRHDQRHSENYEFCRSDGFVDAMVEEIRNAAAKAEGEILSVCLHGRGDFFSVPYVRRWREVMDRTADRANVRYYAYTRVWIDDRFRSELDVIGRDLPHARINLSTDTDNVRDHGIPDRVGDGLVTWLAETDSDLPPEGAAVDLVFRSTLQRDLPPAEFLGGFRVCPNETHLYFSRHDGRVVMENGKPVRITCGECRLCIDRSFEEWDRIKDNHRSDDAPDGGPRALALFAGCGGMTKGFKDAGWDIAVASELDEDAAETHALNHPATTMIVGDITDPAVKARIIEAASGVDLVFGGPPCVAYSSAGKRDPKDPRGRLYVDYLDVVEAVLPRGVAIENVEGITSMQRSEGVVSEVIEARLRSLGYVVHTRVLCAADWGVPQARNRWFLVAVRPGAEFLWPDATHSEKGDVFDGRRPWVTAKEALADLEYAPESAVSSHQFVRHNPEFLAKICRTGPGESVYKFKEPFRRLLADRPALTVKIRNGARPIHYRLDRLLSLREAARLQGFPDDFLFRGNKSAVEVQISNAVPPAMAEAVAASLRQAICIDRGLADREEIKGRSERHGQVEAAVSLAQDGNHRTVTFIDTFAGIGAGRKAVEDACHRLGVRPVCVGFSEIDSHATAVYLRHYPGTPALGDIRDLAKSDSIPKCDVVIGGFPCQGNSRAGRRLGLKDPRSRLVFDLIEVARLSGAKAFLGENVDRLVTQNNGNDLGKILDALRRAGFSPKHSVINSRRYVPQNRPRAYIVAFRGDIEFEFPSQADSSKRLRDVIEADPVDPRYYVSEASLAGMRDRKARHLAKGNGFGFVIRGESDVAGALVCGGMGREGNLLVDRRISEFPALPRRRSPLNGECIRNMTPEEWERLQGLPTGWTAGQADGRRYRQLGNAMTVPVIEAITSSMLAALGFAEPSAPNSSSASTEMLAEPSVGELRVLSLFSGCGGMDLGFEGGFDAPTECVNRSLHPDWIERDHGNGWVRLRSTGFRTVFACDINESAKRIWVRNFSKRGHSPEEFHVASIVDLVKAHRIGEFQFPEADVVTGGFCCQDFSLAGKRKGFASGMDHLNRPMAPDTPTEESRGMLYVWMREVIGIVRPKVFVAENVGAMRSMGDVLDAIRSDFSGVGYKVFVKVLRGPEHGVPQTRERIIFIGLRKDALIAEAPDPHPVRTHGDSRDVGDRVVRFVTTATALRGLPEPGDSDDPSQRSFSGAAYLAPTTAHPDGFQGQKEAPLCRPGPTIRADHHGQIEFRRLSVEHGGKHSDELDAGMPERRLTVRECARLQTFPDDFEFVIEGDVNERVPKTKAYLGVGNAVPPFLAYAISMRLRDIWPAAFGGQPTAKCEGDGARPVIEFPSAVHADASAAIKVAELFAGVGGMRLGAEAAHPNVRTVFASEIDEEATRVYEANHGMAPAGDITRIDASDIPDHDLLLAGFPCTNLSVAGNGEGLSGSGSRLFFEIVRVAQHKQPPLVVIENVPRLLTHDGGRTFEIVRESLERVHYRLHHAILDASGFACPTHRRRVFIVCFRKDLAVEGFAFPNPLGIPTSFKDCLLPPKEVEKYVLDQKRIFVPDGRSITAGSNGAFPQRPVRAGLVDGRDGQGYRAYFAEGHAITFTAAGGGLAGKCGWYLVDGVVRKAAPRECARAMGFSDAFVLPDDDNAAWRQVGNSVAIPVVREVVEAALAAAGLQARERDRTVSVA